MEPTYFGMPFRTEAIDWLNRHTPPAESRVRDHSHIVALFQARGRLKVGISPSESRPSAWYVLQNRPGDFYPGPRSYGTRTPGVRRQEIGSDAARDLSGRGIGAGRGGRRPVSSGERCRTVRRRR